MAGPWWAAALLAAGTSLALLQRARAKVYQARHPPLIIVLAGQSNIAGRGSIDFESRRYVRSPLAEDDSNNARFERPLVYRLAANGCVEEAREPLHIDMEKNKPSGVGPGLMFAQDLARATRRQVVLVPCAAGGTKLEEWAPAQSEYHARLLQQCKRVTAIYDKPIDLLVWMQGESDAIEAQDAARHADQLSLLCAGLRAELGRTFTWMPIIVTGRADKLPLIDEVRAIQQRFWTSMQAEEEGRVLLVDAHGLPLSPRDRLHLTQAGSAVLARSMMQAWISKTNQRCTSLSV